MFGMGAIVQRSWDRVRSTDWEASLGVAGKGSGKIPLILEQAFRLKDAMTE